MKQQEKILHTAMVYMQTALNTMVKDTLEILAIDRINREALISYADVVMKQPKPVCWNPPGADFKVAKECTDHPKVRGSSYMEIHELLGTNGCSKELPYWTWEALGVLETPQGKLVVCPGNWIIEFSKDLFLVMTDEQYQKLYS